MFGIFTRGKVLTPVGLTLGIWIILASLVDPIDRWRRRPVAAARRARHDHRAHGLGLAVIALATVQSFTVERDVALAPGRVPHVGGYEFRFEGVQPIEGPNYGGSGHASR